MGTISHPTIFLTESSGRLFWQIEGFHQKHCHLSASDRTFRAKFASSTAGRDAFHHQLLDPGSRPVIRSHIAKTGTVSDRRRTVAGSILGAQQENCHLSAGDRAFGTVLPTAAASCNPVY